MAILDAITNPLQAAVNASETILEVKGILKFGDEIRNLHANVVAGLKAARIAETEQIAMQREIDLLKREVTDLKATNAKLERYELKRLPPGVFVYALKEAEKGAEPSHYACENCYGNGKIKPLHSLGTARGIEIFKCSGCGNEVRTGYYTPPKPTQARGTDFDVFKV